MIAAGVTVWGEMSDDTSCTFCRIIVGTEPAHIVYEDANAVAFLDRAPAAEGHTLVVPRVHSRTLLDIDLSNAEDLMNSTTLVARLIQQTFHPDGLTMLQTNERAGWQSVFHVHLHLIPRWSGDGLVLPHEPMRAETQTLAATRLKFVLAG
jgi:histidine triad (HIT) family protein